MMTKLKIRLWNIWHFPKNSEFIGILCVGVYCDPCRLPVKLVFCVSLAQGLGCSQRKQKTGTDYVFTGQGRALMVEGAAVGSPLVPR